MERAALFRLTFPATDSANILIDAFDHGSSITIQPEKRRIVGYTTRNSGGVPDQFKTTSSWSLTVLSPFPT